MNVKYGKKIINTLFLIIVSILFVTIIPESVNAANHSVTTVEELKESVAKNKKL